MDKLKISDMYIITCVYINNIQNVLCLLCHTTTGLKQNKIWLIYMYRELSLSFSCFYLTFFVTTCTCTCTCTFCKLIIFLHVPGNYNIPACTYLSTVMLMHLFVYTCTFNYMACFWNSKMIDCLLLKVKWTVISAKCMARIYRRVWS